MHFHRVTAQLCYRYAIVLDGFDVDFACAGGGADGGVDLGVAVDDQVFGGDVNAVAAIGFDGGCEGFVVDGEGDDVAHCKDACDFACDGDAGFG